jgi:two-component system, sensor histidine kinase and response regulator
MHHIQKHQIWRAVVQCVSGVIAVALITLVCFRLQLHEATATCLYLLAIVLLSLQGNFFVSAVVSFIAVGCLDYFFVPPLFSFTVTDPSDAVAFIAFLTASGTITHLVSRVRKLMQEKLQQSEAYLSEAQRLSHTGSFGWRISGGELLAGELLWSEETFRIFQCDRAMKPTVAFVIERTHPQDTLLVKQTIEQAVKEGKDFDFEHRLLMPDGSVKHVHVVAHAKANKPGELEFVGAVMDVTDAKKAQEKLLASERRYAVTLSSIGDAVIATDDRARVTFINLAAETLTAWKSADAIGRPIAEVFQIINEETRAVVEDPAAKVLRLGTVVGLANHTALLARDGRELPIDDCGSPIIGDDGKITGVVLVFRDMTQRRRAEEAELLRRSKERLELAVHGSNLSIWEFDMPDCRIENSRSTLINVWELLGYNPQTAPTDFATVMALEVHPEDVGRLTSAVQVFLAGKGREFEAEYRVRHKDGSDHWRLTRGVAVRNSNGKPVQFIGSCVDITNLKQAEEALRQSEQRFRAFVDHAADAFFLHDERFVILDVNRQACESLGYTRDELLGMTPLDVDPDVTPAALDEIERKLSAGEMMAFESRHRRKDGTIFPVEVRGQAFREGGRRFSVAMVRDMTERKKIEVALKESEHRWRSLTEALPQLVWTARPDGYVDYQSTQFGEYFGLSEDKMLGSQWLELLHPDDRERTRLAWQAAVERDSDYDLEVRLRRFDGVYRWFKTRGARIRDSEGNTLKWFGTCTDITDGKKAEEALRESEHRWRSLTEALPQLVWTAMPDGACDYFSTQWTQYTGLSTSELLGWQWMETLHPDDREPTRQLWTNSVAGRSPYDVEYRVRRADGEYRWFKTRGVPIRDSEGSVFKWFGTCTDITDLRRTEEALRESEERFRGTFENAGVGIAHTHSTGRLLRVNEKFCAIVGYPRAELLQKTFRDITHPDDMTVSVGSLGMLMRGESAVVRHEKRYVRKDGAPVWVELFTSLQRDAAGQPAYAIAVVQDISERRRLDAELRHAKEAAEAANRAKDEFLANVSHEIRTPMNAIMGLTSLVLETDLNDGQRQSLVTVKSAANNLLGIINDLLDFSKIEAGKLELDLGEFWLRATVGDTLRALAVRAHQKGLELVSNVQSDVPDALIGDAGRLRQVLLNLIGNAIKFTEKGEVVVQVRAISDVAPAIDDVHLLFTVRDTGIGIPKEKQATIFRAFEQEDSSTTRKYGGTGLGLTISAQLAGLMGGRIDVESEPGRGSTFSFTARFGRSSKRGAAGTGESFDRLDNLRVLIVDDNVTNCQILEEWLRSWRMRPVAVGDGAAAVDALLHAVKSGAPYSLVLLDGRMPDGDGLTVARQIRKHVDISPTRIILLPSEDSGINMALSREMGISAYLLKPVQQSELLETIGHVMGRTTPGSAPAKVTASTPEPRAFSAPATPLHILVAEDNEFNVILLKHLFDQRGHSARIASNGREAVELATGDTFDLLLLDIHLPEMDGFAVAQAIREQERASGNHLPIIAFTARSGKADRERCLAAGMDDFLSKPVQAEALWEVIDRVVAAHKPKHQTDSGLLDPQAILGACGGEAAILEKICLAFREHIPDHLIAVQDALRERDAVRLGEAVHKLSGMVSVFSTVAGDAASDLEDLAAQGQLEEAAPLLRELERTVEQLLELTNGLSIDSLRAM